MGVNRKLLAVFGAYCSLAPCLQLWNLTVIGVNRKHLTVIGVYFIEKVNVLQHEFKRAPGSASLLPNIFDIFSDARRDKKVDCKTTLSNRQRAVKMTLLTGSAVWRRSLRLTASRTVPVGVKATYWKAYCATIVIVLLAFRELRLRCSHLTITCVSLILKAQDEFLAHDYLLLWWAP